jgi:hypothetical protein
MEGVGANCFLRLGGANSQSHIWTKEFCTDLFSTRNDLILVNTIEVIVRGGNSPGAVIDNKLQSRQLVEVETSMITMRTSALQYLESHIQYSLLRITLFDSNFGGFEPIDLIS